MSEDSQLKVLEILQKQTRQLELQTEAQLKAASECEKKAAECKELQIRQDELREAEERRVKVETKRLQLLEMQSAHITQLIPILQQVIEEQKVTSTAVESITKNTLTVMTLLVTALQSNLSSDTRQQVNNLMDTIKAGFNKSGSVTVNQTDISAARDIKAGKDINIEE